MTKRSRKGDGQLIPLGNGRTQIKIPVGKKPNGDTIYKKQTVDAKDAKRVRAEMLKERDAGTLSVGPRITFRAFAEEWLLGVHDDILDRTADNYLRVLRTHVFHRIGSKVLSDLRPIDIQRVLDEIRTTKAAGTTNNARTAMSKIFAEALRLDLVSVNPVHRTKKAKADPLEPTSKQPPWSVEELHTVMKAAENSPLEAFLAIMLSTGMRLGEVLGLQWSDIEFDYGIIHIQRTVSYDNKISADGSTTRQLSIRLPKTNSSVRMLRVPSPLLDILRAHHAMLEVERLSAGDTWSNEDWVFPNNVGKASDASKVRKTYQKFCAQHNIRHIRLHDIRHTAATVILNEDARLLAPASKMLGHSSTGITIGVYGSTARVEDQATEVLGKIVFPDKSFATLKQIAQPLPMDTFTEQTWLKPRM
jgi:integrase